MDADTVALRAPNELLTVDADFAAVPDIGWPDCFNTGLMVLKPNMADYYALLALAQRGISFDGADQGLLNMHFRDWERLSFVYNCTPSGNYQYVPAYRHFQSSIAVVHFIGQDKPWTLGRDNRYNTGVYGELLGMWWSVYDRHYRPMVSPIITITSKGSCSQSCPDRHALRYPDVHLNQEGTRLCPRRGTSICPELLQPTATSPVSSTGTDSSSSRDHHTWI